MNKLGVYKNNQIQYKNPNGIILTVTAIQDEHFHVSIKSSDGSEYACIMVPGYIWDEITWRTLTKPKSSICVPKEVKNDEPIIIDSREFLTQIIPQLEVPSNEHE